MSRAVFSAEANAMLDQQYPERVAEREQRSARNRQMWAAQDTASGAMTAYFDGDFATALPLFEKAAEMWAALGDRSAEERSARQHVNLCKEKAQ